MNTFQLLAASKYIQPTVHFAGFVYLFEISGKDVEHKCNSSSPIKFWLSLKERTECDDNDALDNIKTQHAGKTIQAIVHYVGFVSIFEFSGHHVEYTHKSITSSPVNFWLGETNYIYHMKITFVTYY